MKIASLCPDEPARLAALRAFDVLDTPAEREFDDLTRLAATICGTPISVISLVDRDRQWFKSKVGVDAEQTGRDVAFCPHAILGRELFIVPDAAGDERFHDNPLVTGAPNIRFYAGAPLTTPDGFNLGTLCAIDRTPRTLTPEQEDALRVLARQVVVQLLLRRQVVALNTEVAARRKLEAELREEKERFRAFMDHSPAIAYMKDDAGRFVFVNKTLADRFGRPVEQWLGKTDHDFFAAEFADEYRKHDLQVLAGGGPVVLSEVTPAADGELTRWRSYKFPFADGGRRMLAGMSLDVTAEVKAADALRESDERFRNAFEDAAVGMAVVSLDGRWVRVNKVLCDTVGYSADELLATDFQTITHPDDLTADLDLVRQVLAGERPTYQMEKRYRHKDGHVVHVLLAVSLVRGAAGEPRYFVSQVQDITARKEAADALRASEAKFRSTVDRLAEGVFVVDVATRRFAEANASLLTNLGYTLAEFVALGPLDLFAGQSPEVYARTVREMDAVLARDGRCDLGRRQFRRKDGSTFPVDVRVTVVPNGGAGLHAVIVRDVTEEVEHEDRLFAYQAQLEEANARLKALAVTDGLTGVKNRAAFNERLGEEFDRATRYGRPLSLILLDVDHFKSFNDTFGHPAGDEVLKVVASSLQGVSRGADLVARYGGEEFVLILPDTELAGALVVAERCRRAVAGRSWDRRPVTISLGVATLTADTADGRAMVAEADAALYRSKQFGRNRVSHGGSGIGVTTPLPKVRV